MCQVVINAGVRCRIEDENHYKIAQIVIKWVVNGCFQSGNLSCGHLKTLKVVDHTVVRHRRIETAKRERSNVAALFDNLESSLIWHGLA